MVIPDLAPQPARIRTTWSAGCGGSTRCARRSAPPPEGIAAEGTAGRSRRADLTAMGAERPVDPEVHGPAREAETCNKCRPHRRVRPDPADSVGVEGKRRREKGEQY